MTTPTKTDSPKTILTKEEKIKRLELKIKKMQAQKKQIESQEKRQERKERARELIQIGAIVAQFHDRKKLLSYLQNPKYVYVDESGLVKRSENIEDTKGKKVAIFIDPNLI